MNLDNLNEIQIKGQILKLSLSAVTPGDNSFIFQLYKETRLNNTMLMHLDETMQELIQRQQFELEDQQFTFQYPNAQRYLIYVEELAVGRFYSNEEENCIHVIALGLLEKYRNLGIGSRILEKVKEEAKARNKKVSLHVTWYNQGAYQLYLRQGFQVAEETPVVYRMEYNPDDIE